ncbi:C-C motif chemokine 20-like isoform X2 [Siniperca chuatsi]|uniref:C-C motif chemokine 20-like isoform X2 n=1 Tax=Siniperca chuatsi TaxID=119488 RepID=UPI001CE22733|nr:C-C motif chemokine 20-like isoform X2 [Siniperca chuatsi]
MHLSNLSPPYSNTFTLLKRLTEAANLSSDLQRNGDMASRVTALLLLGVICVGFATAEIAVDCCLTIGEKRLPLHILVSYTIQEAGQGCEISATAFITKVGRTLCVSHPSKQAWVKAHIDFLEKKKQRQQ